MEPSFQRGKQQGKSPLALAGGENVPSLAGALDMLLGYHSIIPAAA